MSDDQLAPHIQEALDAGRTPDQIVDKFKQNYPDQAPLIDEAVKAGRTPDQIVGKLKTMNYSDLSPKQPEVKGSGVLDQLQHSVADEVGGISNTLKKTVGSGDTTDQLDSAARGVEPQGYVPPQFNWRKLSTYGELPKALAAGGAGMAGDLAAGAAGAAVGSMVPVVGTTIGGIVGAGAHALARLYGNKLDEAQEADKTTGQAPTPGQMARAAATSMLTGATSRLGVGSAAGGVIAGDAASGALSAAANKVLNSSLGQTALEGAKAAAITAAGTAADKAIIHGELPTVDELGNSAVEGGAGGAAVRSARVLRDIRANGLGGDDSIVSPEAKARLAQRYTAARLDPVSGTDVNHAGGDGSAFQKVGSDLKSDLSDAVSNVAPILKAHSELNPTDPTAPALDRVLGRLKDHLQPDAGDRKLLETNLGNHAEGQSLLHLIDEQYGHNSLAKQGTLTKNGEFIGGAQGSPLVQDYASLGGSGTRYMATHALVYGLIHGGAGLAHAGQLMGGLGGINLASRALDSVTGLHRPLDDFIARNQGNGTGVQQGLASFRQNQSDIKKQEALDLAKSKDMAATQKQAEGENKVITKNALKAEQDKQDAAEEQLKTLISASRATSRATKNAPKSDSDYQDLVTEPPEAKQAPLTFAQKPSADIPGMTNQQVADLVRSKKQVDNLDAIKARSAEPDPMQGWAEEQARRLGLMRNSSALEMQQARANAATEGIQLDQYGQPTSTSTGPNLRASRLASALEAARESAAPVEESAPKAGPHSKLDARGKAVELSDIAAQAASKAKIVAEAKMAKASARQAKIKAAKVAKAAHAKASTSHHTTGGADKSHGAPKAPSASHAAGHITVHSPAGHSVTRSLEGINNHAAYEQQIKNNVNERHRVISQIMTEQPHAKTALHDLNIRLDTTGTATHQGHINEAMKHIKGGKEVMKVTRARLEGLLKLKAEKE